MKLELVRIGNSRGIRIPKPVLEQCGLADTVELTVKDKNLVIAAARKPREGWEEAFRAAARPAPAELLLEDPPPNQFDQEEWRW